MTRETKIGLLVGLAFIIVIGILLSDHLSVTAEPPQAALVQAGKSVREGIAVPGAPTTPLASTTPAPVNVTPQYPVPTQQDLHPPVQRPEAIVSIQAGGQPQYQPPITIQHHAPEVALPPQANYSNEPTGYQMVPQETISGSIPPVTGVDVPAPTYPVAGADPIEREVPTTVTPLNHLAQQFGEQVVSVNDTASKPASTGSRATSETLEAKEYVATEGDSLSKIAARFYGRSTKETRDLIVKANPSLKDDPNLIIAGRTYLIPQKGLTVTPAPQPVQTAQATQARGTARPAATVTYKVKDGDTLWKIAKEQCGSPRELQAIRDLNKDVLKGSDTVIVGMSLRLPNRSVASVQ